MAVLQSSKYDYDYEDFVREEFYSGERICAPSNARGRFSSLLRVGILASVFGASMWLWLNDRELVETWTASVKEAVASVMQRNSHVPQEIPASPSTVAASALPSAPREIADAPGIETGTEIQSPPTLETLSDSEASEAKPVPLPPVTADPGDPLQKRALAAGLHPELSHAVLTRLTDKDFRNAATAIKTALAASSNLDSYTFPKASRKGATFEIHFVAAAAADCRRYVVVVTLDRWSTTAPAMEKCGSELPSRGSKSAAG